MKMERWRDMCYDMRKIPNYFYHPLKLRSWFKHLWKHRQHKKEKVQQGHIFHTSRQV